MNTGFSMQDIRKNKLKAAIGYIAFFVPLLLCGNSKLGRHCANQGLLLLIVNVLFNLVLGMFTWLPLVGWLFSLARKLVSAVLFLIGAVCFVRLVAAEHVCEVPIVGVFRLIR